MVEIAVPNFQEWRTTSDGPLHVVFIVHMVLMSWSMLGFWSGNKLMIHDGFLLICILWSLHNKNTSSPIVLSLVIDVISIILDIIVLAVWYPHEAKSSEQFSAVMAIFNLIFRLASIYVLYQCWKERRDNFDGIYTTSNISQSIPAPISVLSTGPSRSNSRAAGQRPQPPPANMEANAASTNKGYAEISGTTFHEEGYGYSTGSQAYQQQRQELPPIPPSYSQHA